MTAEVMHDGMTFISEAALIAFQSAEDPRTPEAVRQQRHRNCEKRADTYWEFRIKGNRVLPDLIAGVSAGVVGQAKVRVVARLKAYVELYPERVTE